MSDLAFAGVNGQLEALRAGEVSSADLLELSLSRIERYDPQLLAFRTLFDESAHEEARLADKARAEGDERPLLGLPIAVKDSMAVAGHSTSHGTGSHEPPATENSELVRRLREAGAVIVGTTKLPELALWPFTESETFGTTRNPWDLSRTPGGSSGGSAAAVAAGLIPAALASDGGGSIRIPAACCGLVGLKPTRRLVRLGAIEHWHGLSVGGCVTRSIADTVTLLNVLQDVPLAVTTPTRLRIAWSLKTPTPATVDPVVKAALHRVVGRLHDLGHDVVHADPDYAGVQESFVVRYTTGAADDLEGLSDPHAVESRTAAVARIGRLLRGRPLARAMRLGDEAARRMTHLPGGADVLITPTLAGLPQPAESLQGVRTLALAGRRAPFTPTWNVTGQPALSIPAGFSAEGLPLAVQLIGSHYSESLLLSVGAQLENWLDARPPLT
jgi:amidase